MTRTQINLRISEAQMQIDAAVEKLERSEVTYKTVRSNAQEKIDFYNWQIAKLQKELAGVAE